MTSSTTEPLGDVMERLEAMARAEAAADGSSHMLVVDDEESIRLALSRFLRSRGYSVDTAASAAGALDVLRNTRVALMLCDLRMPGMSGLELLPHALALDADLAVVMLTAVNDANSATVAMTAGALDYLTKPVELVDLHAAVDRALLRRAQRRERRHVERLIREEVAERTAALHTLTLGVAQTLVNAMEAKDVYLRGHSERVATLSARMAERLGASSQQIADIRVAGQLHDIGKIGIAESVLHKPGPLSQEEFAVVQSHVRIGIEILAPLDSLGEGLRYIHDHHEHWDGSGYPRGLVGEGISWGGRILTAADAFDALTSQRAYRRPMSASESLDYLFTQRGRLLDPQAYDALVAEVRAGASVGPNGVRASP